MVKKKGDLEGRRDDSSESKEDDTGEMDLIEASEDKGPEVKEISISDFTYGIKVYFIVLAYVLLLMGLTLFLPTSIAFILWILAGVGIYKGFEAYGEDKPWFSELSEMIQNFGFSGKKEDDWGDGEVEDIDEVDIEEPQENPLSFENYAEKFDEWRVTKDTVSAPFISAGEKISKFSFNSKGLYKLRLWIFLILVPLLVWIIMWDIVSWPFLIWFSFWFSYEDALNLSRICSLILSYFIIIRIYSHCTNNRNLPINSDMMSDFDDYAVSHLFRLPTDKDSVVLTGRALLIDFIGGYLILIFTSIYAMQSYDLLSRYSLNDFYSQGYPSFIFMFLCIAVFVPIMEELMFRGFVLDLASEAYGKWASILISAIFFAIIHPLYILNVLNAFWAGLIYGYIRIRTNSLWPSIILHSAWNAHIIIIQFFA